MPDARAIAGKEDQPGDHEQQQAQADRRPRSRRPGRSAAPGWGSSGTAGLRMCACGWSCAPACMRSSRRVSPCRGPNSRKLLAAAPATSLERLAISFSSAAYCWPGAGCLPSLSSGCRAPAAPRLFSGASFSQFPPGAARLSGSLHSALQGLGRRRQLCRDPQSRAGSYHEPRGEPSVVHRPGRSVLPGNRVPGEQPPQPAVLADPRRGLVPPTGDQVCGPSGPMRRPSPRA